MQDRLDADPGYISAKDLTAGIIWTDGLRRKPGFEDIIAELDRRKPLKPRAPGTHTALLRAALQADATTPYALVAEQIGIGKQGACQTVKELEKQDRRSYREGRMTMMQWKARTT